MQTQKPWYWLVLPLLLIFYALTAYSDEAVDRAQLERVRASIAKLKAELEATKNNRDELMQSLEKSEKNIGELSKKATQLKQELGEQQEELEELRDERSHLQKNKSQQQKQVAQHINAAYRLGQQSSLRLLLNQQDPSSVSRNLKYYDYLIRARADKISSFTSTIQRINTIEPEIAYQTEKLEQKHRQLSERKTQLEHAHTERKATLSQLNQSISTRDQELKSLFRDRSRLEQLLDQVAEWLDEIKIPETATGSFASNKGKLPWPTEGRVIKRFGASRVANKLRWQGLLIGSDTGSPVMAVHHGRIVFSDYLRGHGLLIIIDHGGGYMSLYAHNQALYKELGEWVDRGETIASVGNSGGQQQSALYFELRYRGKPTNPSSWFRPA